MNQVPRKIAVYVTIKQPKTYKNFYVLLTVHLTIILACKNSCFIISLLYACTCFEHYVLISSVGQNCIIQHLVSSYLYVAVRCAGWERTVHGTATYSVWWYQMLYNTIFTSWWWAQQYSKHVEEYTKLITKQEFVH